MSQKIIRELVKLYSERCKTDIVRGIKACKKVWDFKKSPEKEFEEFCLHQYVPPGRHRTMLLERLDEFHKGVAGSMGMGMKVARAGQDIADRPDLVAESIFSAYAPGMHLPEDFRKFKIAALAQLNFGSEDIVPPRSRAAWAARRLGDIGREVIPADLLAEHSAVQTEVDHFISSYNLHLDRFDFGDSKIRFPKGTRLISHWGLRDYMMELNGQKDALPKQRAILNLMKSVVDGDIPAEVLNNSSVKWDIPNSKIIAGDKEKPADGHGPLRWGKFREVWLSTLKIDPHTRYGNVIDEKFLVDREMTEEKVVKILTDIISSPLAERVADYISHQLGRDLEPFDIYYKTFLGKGVGKKALRFDIRKRFPNAEALQKAIPGILVKLGWKKDRAEWIASKIRVDNGRSAGHAWPPYCSQDLQLLRVRVDDDGCSEMSFETFMHELGHCVEGVLSSFEMDYQCLWGVPNTAFTEGFAFTFQNLSDEILGRSKQSSQEASTLLRFWEPFEIAGSALTEIRFYHWLYKNKKATPLQMMKAIRRIGDKVWQEFYARIFGSDGYGIMSIYSHILWGTFYLAEYPMGYVIAYQVRKFLEGKPLPEEMTRMCRSGRIYPEQWMKAAVGQGISVSPLLDDTAKALKKLGF